MEQAHARTTGLLPNPRVEWERQETFQPNAQGQDILRIALPLDPSGRPHARRALAQLEAELAAAEAARARAVAVEGALELFYGALATARRAEVRAQSLASLEEAQRVLAAREARGDSSGYDTARLALAAELERSRVRELELEASAARARLAALLGAPAPDALDGTLEVEPPASLEVLLTQARALREDWIAVRRASEEAGRARSAADWAWVPSLELTGGYNRQAAPGLEGHGYLFVLSLEVPLFDHGQAERERAAAASVGVAAYLESIEQRIETEVQAAREQLVGLAAERARFAQSAAGPLEVLLRASEAGYREGERSVLELVDARRAATEAAERLLALDLAMRIAQTKLQTSTGAAR